MILDELLQCSQSKIISLSWGFNYWNVFADQTYHFNCWGMFLFIVVLQAWVHATLGHLQCPGVSIRLTDFSKVLNWGMIIAASMRSTLQASMETNEVGMRKTETWSRWMWYSCDVVSMKWDWEIETPPEVIFLSMDNLWRSTQSLYVTLPLHFYSFTKATEVGGDFWMSFFLPNVAWIIDWPSTHFDFCQAIMTQN